MAGLDTEQEISLYVGCSLTQAPAGFVDDVTALKATLRDQYEVSEFVGLVDGTPRDVYEWDIKRCVGSCTLFIAICDYPSIGLGYELGTAVEKHQKPVLAVAHHASSITRLVLGIDAPGFSFERYDDMQLDVPRLIDQKVRGLSPTTT